MDVMQKKIANRFEVKHVVIAVGGLLVVALVVVAGYFYLQVQELKNPNIGAEKELKETIAKVSELMILPEGEMPTLATVSDPEKLKNEPFFTNAILGDKVLIYSQSKKAVLYSPTRKKIIEVSSFNMGSTESSETRVPLPKQN